MPFTRKEVEEYLEALERAGRDLRGKIGYIRIERTLVKVNKIITYCTLENSEGKKRLMVKYDGEKLWVEGPRWASLPLKNRILYYLSKR
ncbi:hypothetical protein [Ignicoccus hospitalis]|uniref:Uncharacterized protein n=1 Tax=Ignicoccus hospitalis (strain KIN4/I / DSM 18386 / JCM 14125) TaxID=453591 RepID=A8AB00_IGNH4|nr:hypothetical protein [Ignicoccus hospitalis]ABU82102.1 hypothetical protein Igni_0922 [Ignicoccus hospitalis KIN4/I]HIH91060.1 hypothetical protein [Desulfurococcaceae archaeon]